MYQIPPHFLVREGPLAYYAARDATIVIGWEGSEHMFQMCRIIFHKKLGSIFVQFTYFHRAEGYVALKNVPEGENTSKVDFKKDGYFVTSHVKYSHPPDGNAHFSQDRRVKTTLRRQALPLDGPMGSLFELHAFRLSGFRRFIKPHENSKRLFLPAHFNYRDPPAIVLSVDWRSKEHIASFGNPGETLGPQVILPRYGDGTRFKAMLLGQPKGYPLTDHLLALNIGAAPDVLAVTEPTIIFMGGWDPPSGTRGPGGGFLSFMYPAGSGRNEGPSLDWQPD